MLLVWVVVLAFKLRRIRRGQKVVLGADSRDIVRHAEDLQRQFSDLQDWLEEASTRLDERMVEAELRLDNTLAYRAMIRYDAYGEMSGQQSSTVALLDAHRTGLVLSAILHRNHSHLYVKSVVQGKSDIDLSPEEERTIEQAMTDGPKPLTAPPRIRPNLDKIGQADAPVASSDAGA